MLTSVTSEKWKSGYQNDSSRSGACDYKRRPFVIAGAFGLVLTRVGGSDDEGIDGIGTAPLSDVLSTRVAVQAKRYDPTGKPVGRGSRRPVPKRRIERWSRTSSLYPAGESTATPRSNRISS